MDKSLYDLNERRRIAELIVGDDEPEGCTREELIASLMEGLHPDAPTYPIETLWERLSDEA